ncbi:hypothetical protein AQ616_09390 [Oceanobacillus sp. E9]|uniref:sigma-70 family RNA polymerase sigma factor n=1 Tax=Oceanobacillus sp. E9 TaxID=1742575 RepID=UPI00084E5F11|nr:sigma-70 family RNA polymerase sigma factor [Oceanobacillus sp. E9]OEH55245.1 hypothetical protein AQ616_09390 [Oceanobacillus sp. E9]
MKVIEGLETEESVFVEQNQNLVWSVVKKFAPYATVNRFEKDDFFNEGCIGLLQAYRKFDESYGFKFSTFAVPYIKGHIARLIRDRSKLVKVGRGVTDLANRIKKENLLEKSVEEICEVTGEARKKVLYALESITYEMSFDEPVFNDDSSGEITVEDTLGKNQDYTEMFVDEFKTFLTQREINVLELRMNGAKQSEIGSKLGLSQVQCSRELKKIGEKYKKYQEGEQMPKLNMTVEEFIDKKYQKKMTDSDIAVEKGVSSQSIYNFKQKHKRTIDSKVKGTAPVVNRNTQAAEDKYYELLEEGKRKDKVILDLKNQLQVSSSTEQLSDSKLEALRETNKLITQYLALVEKVVG